MRKRSRLLELILVASTLSVQIGCSKVNEKKEVQFETEAGTQTVTVTTMDNFPQKISQLNTSEKGLIDDHAAACVLFAKEYLDQVGQPSLKDLDLAFSSWTSDRKQYSDDDVRMMIGSYLGNYFVASANMEWVFVEDQYGKDYAVQSRVYDVLAFPFSTVQKRIDSKETGFINNVYLSTLHQLDDTRSKRR